MVRETRRGSRTRSIAGPALRPAGTAQCGSGQSSAAPPLANPAVFCAIIDRGAAGNNEMESEKFAGILGAIIAAVVLVIAIAFGPIGQFGKPPKPAQTVDQPKPAVAAPAVRGPVVREVPQ